jgi:hypothetical protein
VPRRASLPPRRRCPSPPRAPCDSAGGAPRHGGMGGPPGGQGAHGRLAAAARAGPAARDAPRARGRYGRELPAVFTRCLRGAAADPSALRSRTRSLRATLTPTLSRSSSSQPSIPPSPSARSQTPTWAARMCTPAQPHLGSRSLTKAHHHAWFDCRHRGLVLGALLGAQTGSSRIPPALKDGLHRTRQKRSSRRSPPLCVRKCHRRPGPPTRSCDMAASCGE